MIETAANLALIILAGALFLGVYRLLWGPTMPDRAVALDTVVMALIGIIGVAGIRSGIPAYFEAPLLLGALAFISSVAMAKFLSRGDIVDRSGD